MRIFAGPAVLALALAGLAQAQHVPKPMGQLIDLGGRKLHLACQGEGGPAVILDSGAGEFSLDWSLLMPLVAKTTRVCAWDRAGYAWSGISRGFEQFAAAAQDMHDLLRKAGIDPPYILAGHAMGALYARDYLQRYPAEVAGLALIDPMPEEDVQVKMFGNIVSLIDMADHDLVAWPVRPYAPSRTSPPPSRSATGAEPPFDKLAPEMRRARRWALASLRAELNALTASQAHDVMESERSVFFDLYNLRHTQPASIPTVVLSRGRDTSPEIRRMQEQQATVAKNAERRTIEDSGTFIHVEKPDAVAAAILEIVKTVRAGGSQEP